MDEQIEATSPAPVYEDLQVGDAIPELVIGPVREPHLMRWSAAIENWHRIHYDQPFATGHDKLPGLLINGSWKQHILVQLVSQWVYPTGWLREIDFQFRAMDVVGSTLTAWGVITAVDTDSTYGLVSLQIGIRNQDGVESTPGTAVVVLPLASGPAVPYPFPRA